MKHMIKKTMLTGALSCFLLGTALADDATNQPAKPYWQDIQVVAVNKEAPRSSFMSYGSTVSLYLPVSRNSDVVPIGSADRRICDVGRKVFV